MIDEWGGTLTLTEASSRELMRVLKEQDAEFMDALFNGECGFTLKCTDGRSVELVPKADHKTESSSEKPNNCECEPRKEQNFCGKCRYLYRDFKYGLSCYRLMDNEPCKYEERKTEPTISKMEQVETMSCAECKHRPIGAEICEEPCHYEPQTDWHYDEQDATWYPYKHEDEPQANADQHVQHVGSVESVEPTWTKEEHEAFYTFLWNVINPNEMQDYIEMFETKDEPQKWEKPPKFEHKGIQTACVSVPMALIEDEPQTEDWHTWRDEQEYNDRWSE